MLIEILVSALVLTIASAAVVTVMAASVSTAGEQRHGSEAYALAQQDQSRLASMRLVNLNHLEQHRPMTLNGTTFEVHSYGLWINNNSQTQSCTAGVTADYVQITSEVTWPGMDASEKAKIQSILSPSGAQSLDPNHGTLPVTVTNEKGEGIPGVTLSGSQVEGTGVISGQTDANGCANFPDLPIQNAAGTSKPNYKVTAESSFAGAINKDGLTKETREGAAKSSGPATLDFRFDYPGTIPVNFKYRVGSSSEFKPDKADSLVVNNSSMTSARTFLTTSGAREATVNASPLFPFNSPYSIYAGTCPENNPNKNNETNPPGAAAITNVVAPARGTAVPGTIQLPALNLTVKYNSVAFQGARVTVTDKGCKEAKGNLVKRVFTTNKEGKMSETPGGVAEPGLPWGIYELCVSAEVKPTEKPTEKRLVKVATVTVQNLTAGTTQNVELATGESGKTCP